MNILFLDIDGVLNSSNGRRRESFKHNRACTLHTLFEENMEVLRSIIDVINCKIVISSTWRNNFTLEELKTIFSVYNIPKHIIIDTTIVDHNAHTRGFQINEWLKNNRVNKFVIIDDDVCDIDLPNTIKINGEFGLTFNDAEKIIQLFNKDFEFMIDY